LIARPLRVLELRSVRGTGGGPEKTILFGARHADPSRYIVTVCYIRDTRDTEFTIDRRAAELGIDYVEVLERHSLDPAPLPALVRLVRARGIDLVHGHEYKTNLLAWLLAKWTGVTPMSTVHGWFGSGTMRERAYYAADKRLLRGFPRLVAVSDPLRRELIAAGCAGDRITVIPNGIDDRRFVRQPDRRPVVRRELGLTDDDIVIGAVGRLEHQKRFDLLMDAVAALRGRWPRLRLLIAGDGGLAATLEAHRRRLSLEPHCTLLGHRSDIVALHHAFDLFVQASDEEGSPNVVLEAMALETPVVATAAGGTADLIDNGIHGLIVPAGDARALMAAIERALGHPDDARAWAVAARRRVQDEFSFARRMARVEQIYDELARLRPALRTAPARG
jgi:glycosyltransferase involved in cell wall biosynthesis